MSTNSPVDPIIHIIMSQEWWCNRTMVSTLDPYIMSTKTFYMPMDSTIGDHGFVNPYYYRQWRPMDSTIDSYITTWWYISPYRWVMWVLLLIRPSIVHGIGDPTYNLCLEILIFSTPPVVSRVTQHGCHAPGVFFLISRPKDACLVAPDGTATGGRSPVKADARRFTNLPMPNQIWGIPSTRRRLTACTSPLPCLSPLQRSRLRAFFRHILKNIQDPGCEMCDFPHLRWLFNLQLGM